MKKIFKFNNFFLFSLLIYLYSCASSGIKKSSSAKDENTQSLLHNISDMERVFVKKDKKSILLHLAAKSGDLELVRQLVQNGYDVNTQDSRKNIPLHYAIINNHFDVAKFLINKGSNVKLRNNRGRTILHMTALSLQTKNKNLPSLPPIKSNFTSYYGLRVSPFTGKYHFHYGIDIAAPVGTKIRAAANGRVIKFGWNKTLGRMITIRHLHNYKTVYGHCDNIRVNRYKKVKRGEVIATVGSTGNATGSHIHYEVRHDGIPINPYPYLNTHSSNEKSTTALKDMVKLLQKKGANINKRDYSGRTPLHYTVLRDLKSTELFVQLGAKVNKRDNKGLTPLHYAVITNIRITKFLLQKGAYVNARIKSKFSTSNGKYYLPGTTPLQMALKNEWLAMAKLLWRYGGK